LEIRDGQPAGCSASASRMRSIRCCGRSDRRSRLWVRRTLRGAVCAVQPFVHSGRRGVR
jgi:hypothetical protein